MALVKEPKLKDLTKIIEAWLEKLPQPIDSMVEPTVASSKAQWLLRPVSIEQAKQDYDLRLNDDSLLLLRVASGDSTEPVRQVFGSYRLNDPAMTDRLAIDLSRIYRWENLWSISSQLGCVAGEPNDCALIFEVNRIDPRTKSKSALTGQVHVGEQLEFSFTNDSIEDLWLSVLYLGSDYGIEELFSQSIPMDGKIGPIVAPVKKGSSGTEGMIVLAMPLSLNRHRPDYAYLIQQPLGTTLTRGSLGRENPIAKLAGIATRGAFDAKPTIVSQSWTIVRDNRKPDKPSTNK